MDFEDFEKTLTNYLTSLTTGRALSVKGTGQVLHTCTLTDWHRTTELMVIWSQCGLHNIGSAYGKAAGE